MPKWVSELQFQLEARERLIYCSAKHSSKNEFPFSLSSEEFHSLPRSAHKAKSLETGAECPMQCHQATEKRTLQSPHLSTYLTFPFPKRVMTIILGEKEDRSGDTQMLV